MLNFGKNVQNSGLDKFMGRCITTCGDDHVTKSRNRKLIRVTLSNECLKHRCVDLSDYDRYLNQIWYKTQYHTINTSNGQFHITWKSKMAAAAILEFHVMWKEKCLTPDWIKIICIKFYRIMHWTFAYTTACTTVQAMITACRLVLEHSDSEKKYSDSTRFSETNRFFSIWFDLAHHCRIGVYIGYSLTMLSNVNIFLFTTLEQTC